MVTRKGEGFVDDGVLPLAYFLDGTDDAVAASVEVEESGAIMPMIYVRERGEIREHAFESHPLHDYESDTYRHELGHCSHADDDLPFGVSRTDVAESLGDIAQLVPALDHRLHLARF